MSPLFGPGQDSLSVRPGHPRPLPNHPHEGTLWVVGKGARVAGPQQRNPAGGFSVPLPHPATHGSILAWVAGWGSGTEKPEPGIP